MGAAFSLRRTSVKVTKETLAQIADILGVSPAVKTRIMNEGIVITAPSGATGTAAAAARSGRTRQSAASAPRAATRRTTRRPRQE